MKKQFAVIGLGRFGVALCEELHRQGEDVLAIDIEEEHVRRVADVVAQAIVADASQEGLLRDLDLNQFDIVFIAIGGNIYASILATLILKECGVKKVWVKAADRLHERILRKIGADMVILPEKEMGTQAARKMIHDRQYRSLSLGGQFVLADLKINEANLEKTRTQLEGFTAVKILAIKRGDVVLTEHCSPEVINSGDVLVLAGEQSDIDELMS